MQMTRIPELAEPPPENDLATKRLDLATRDEAFNQGAWAYTFGLDEEYNPYAVNDLAYGWWSEGWQDSESNCGG